MNHVIDIGTGEGGGEWDIEGQVDGGIDSGGRSHRRSAVRSPKSVGGHVSMRSRHAKGRCHPLPAMTGLARKIGDLVHDTRIDRISDPLNKSRGKRGGGAEGGKWRKLIREEFGEEKEEEGSISRRTKSPFSTGMIGGGRRRMEWCRWTRA